jgi:hypothetical protein
MKILIFFTVIFTFIFFTGCSTTTYINLNENKHYKVMMLVDDVKINKDLEAEVSLLLKDGSKVNGELLSIRDNTLTIRSEYAASEDDLTNLKYPVTAIITNGIQEFTIEGSSYVWTGVIIGYIVGGVTGFLIGQANKNGTSKDEGLAAMGGMIIGGSLGALVGGIAGYALSTEEYVMQEIPVNYYWATLKAISRYPNEEPEYLRAIK